MKGTIFAVALNHRSQLDAWREAFQQAPYKDAAENRGLVYQAAQYRNWRWRSDPVSAGRDRTKRRNGGADCRQNRA
ncbi:5-carboxymethyl-2-oxo-hex-3- ene-1,7-dioate decarboxylase [Klebsiella pneumoniae]|uniref:5-carboxymethyl-2-oxo-hex-3- ene-1,7-dioate decarboxylase n=1 Tax=Klebsiella pneumoniae TaxID=573 RepID=A0A4P0XLF0_KLEPN|nr:5-carboxymethyl-2-oxo-hex-3- ene-1,7-dioate decarboxylase [Klebsiella pneumoniae]